MSEYSSRTRDPRYGSRTTDPGYGSRTTYPGYGSRTTYPPYVPGTGPGSDEPEPEPDPPKPTYEKVPWEKDLSITGTVLDQIIPMVYGSRKVTGQIGSWYYNSGTKKLYLGVIFAYGEQNSISNVMVNGELVSSLSWVNKGDHVGDGTTSLSTYLTSSTSGWTADDTTLWKTLCHTALEINCRTGNTPSSFTIEADLGGKLIDTTWRTAGGSASVASSNPAEVAYHMMTDSQWRGLASSKIDADSFEQVAEWCEETMGDASDRYSFNGIVKQREPDSALAMALQTCIGSTYIGADGKVHLWAEMAPPAITGDWSASASATITEDATSGAANTDLAVGEWVYAGTNLRQVVTITDDDTVVLDSAVTITGEKVRRLSQVYVKKHDWLRAPSAYDADSNRVPDKIRIKFDDANNRGSHEVLSTYGSGTDKIQEENMPGCTDAGTATRVAETKLKVQHLQPFMWGGIVMPETAASLEPGDVLLFDNDLLTAQAARVLPPVQHRTDGSIGLSLIEYDPSAYSDSTETTDTPPSLGGGFVSNDPPVFDQINTVYSSTEYQMAGMNANGRIEVGSSSTNTVLTATQVRLPNNVPIYGLNTSAATIGLLKVNSSNQTQLGDGTQPIYLMSTELILDAAGKIRFDQSSPKTAMGWSAGSSYFYIGNSSNRCDILGSAVYLNPVVSGNVYINGATTHLGASSAIEMTNNNVWIKARTYSGGLMNMVKANTSDELLFGSTSYKTQIIGAPPRISGKSSSTGDPTTTHFDGSEWGIHINTTSGNVYLAYNKAGVIKKVQLT